MLTLAMQSGAFLQLVVTLTALVARLAHLSSTIRSVLSTLHADCLCLLTRLHVRNEQPFTHAPPTRDRKLTMRPFYVSSPWKPYIALRRCSRHLHLKGRTQSPLAACQKPTNARCQTVILMYRSTSVRRSLAHLRSLARGRGKKQDLHRLCC